MTRCRWLIGCALFMMSLSNVAMEQEEPVCAWTKRAAYLDVVLRVMSEQDFFWNKHLLQLELVCKEWHRVLQQEDLWLSLYTKARGTKPKKTEGTSHRNSLLSAHLVLHNPVHTMVYEDEHGLKREIIKEGEGLSPNFGVSHSSEQNRSSAPEFFLGIIKRDRPSVLASTFVLSSELGADSLRQIFATALKYDVVMILPCPSGPQLNIFKEFKNVLFVSHSFCGSPDFDDLLQLPDFNVIQYNMYEAVSRVGKFATQMRAYKPALSSLDFVNLLKGSCITYPRRGSDIETKCMDIEETKQSILDSMPVYNVLWPRSQKESDHISSDQMQ